MPSNKDLEWIMPTNKYREHWENIEDSPDPRRKLFGIQETEQAKNG